MFLVYVFSNILITAYLKWPERSAFEATGAVENGLVTAPLTMVVIFLSS